MHADFMRVSSNVKIKVNIPIHFVNEDTCYGVKTEGGMIQQQATDIEILCLPADIPEYLEVDMLELKVGDIVHLSDVKLPEGVESTALSLGEDHGLAIARVLAPKGGAEEAEAVEAGGADAAGGDGGARGRRGRRRQRGLNPSLSASVPAVSEPIRLIVGLGNPGEKYRGTRHNAGADFVELLARQYGVTLQAESQFFGFSGRLQSAVMDIRLLVPAAYVEPRWAVGGSAGQLLPDRPTQYSRCP